MKRKKFDSKQEVKEVKEVKQEEIKECFDLMEACEFQKKGWVVIEIKSRPKKTWILKRGV
jgi:hypothetical protein